VLTVKSLAGRDGWWW